MDRPVPGGAYEALQAFLGQWTGATQWHATPWGPARSAAADVEFSRAVAGLAVTMGYSHTDPHGARSEGHGVFTTDPGRPDLLWYHVNSLGLPREAPARAAWLDGTLVVERRSDHGTARHTYRLDGGVLTHTAAVRLGKAREFIPFLTSVYRRVPAPAAVSPNPAALGER